jgi:hypothetical protein
MVMSKGFKNIGIPEKPGATGLHLFESARDILR